MCSLMSKYASSHEYQVMLPVNILSIYGVPCRNDTNLSSLCQKVLEEAFLGTVAQAVRRIFCTYGYVPGSARAWGRCKELRRTWQS